MTTITSLTMASRVLRSQILKPTCCRNLVLSHPKKFLLTSSSKLNSAMGFAGSEKSHNRLKRMDNISDEYELIYRAPMELLLKLAYPIVGVCVVVPPIHLTNLYIREGKISLASNVNYVEGLHFTDLPLEVSLFGGGLALLALGTYGIIFKYAFRVYKHKKRDEYIALFLSYVPFLLKKFHFQCGTRAEFKNPFYSFMMKGCHYRLDSKNAFLMIQYFRTPVDLYRMLGD